MNLWKSKALNGDYDSKVNQTELTYNLNEKSFDKYLIYSGHDQQIAVILDHLVPNYNYTEIKYSSTISVDLLQDNYCTISQSNIDDCLYVRMKYNGNFVDLQNGNIFEDSAV